MQRSQIEASLIKKKQDKTKQKMDEFNTESTEQSLDKTETPLNPEEPPKSEATIHSDKQEPKKTVETGVLDSARLQEQQFGWVVKCRALVKRNRLVLSIASIALLFGLGLLVWWYLLGQYRQTTADAYVEGNVVLVSAQLGGTVTGIYADTTDWVKEGQVLVDLNPVDAQLTLDKAKAALAQSVRSVRTQFASKDKLLADLNQKQAELARTKTQYQRRQELAQSGALSTEEIQNARQTVQSAQAAVVSAQKQLSGGQAQVDNTSVQSHPNVLNAIAVLTEAYVNAKRTQIPAPVAGMVTKRNVQIGQRVAVGTTLMSIVPLGHLWVSANFKESQLQDLRIGQTVQMTTDMYGRRVSYKGRILGLDAGTGSAFALLPAQNATGNWIKVVQRVPVRIALDAKEVAEHPLRIGLSMKVTVNTKNTQNTRPMDTVTPTPQRYQTAVFAHELDEVDALIADIIRENMGRKPQPHE